MKTFLFLFLFVPSVVNAQSYEDELLEYRQGYKTSLMHSGHPLKAEDTGYLRFYAPDPDYRVKAQFVITTAYRPFTMNTMHGGKKPAVREYGMVYFTVKGAPLTMYVYRFLTKPEDNTDASIRLFIPFTDRTNFKETFGGGRYLDVSAEDILNGNLVLDFNKCYNPHTAYEKNYPYIIPPDKNNLHVEIKAGEKIFGHNPGY